MTEIETILKPNVYVFAFHLISDTRGKDNPLWNWADEFLESFTSQKLKSQLQFPEPPSKFRVDLLPEDISLNFESKINHQNRELEVSGFAFPLQIGDSYALFLNVGLPDSCIEEVSPQLLSKFNPQNLLGIVTGEEFLGETILITAKLPSQLQSASPEELQSLADKCCNALLPEQYRPTFHRHDKLFGSPIFEYGLTKQIANYRHLLVWFPHSEASEDKLSIYQQEILDLFYYRNKIIKSFQNSRQIHGKLLDVYREVENNVGELQQQIDRLNTDLTPENLQEFKTELKKLLRIALAYTQGLTKLEDYDNTIAINLNNCNEKLEQIRVKVGVDKEELSILNNFSRKTAPYMRSQIAGDLGYFKHGTDLIESAIASIRGIVEIEQARSDRETQQLLRNNEKADNERGEKLEKSIQAIGVGLAAGGIAASSGPEKLLTTLQNHHIPVPHPFIFSFSLSIAIAALAWCITRWLLGKGQP
ncbi:hypothetical protein [Phormidium nigroviride]